MCIKSRGFINPHEVKDEPWICLKCSIVKHGDIILNDRIISLCVKQATNFLESVAKLKQVN